MYFRLEAIFNNSIENHIIRMTNIEGQRIYLDKWQNIDNKTLQSYFGLLILAGVYKSHGESTKSLWDKETGRNIFRSTMSLEKFCILSRVLRFDDRRHRKSSDKLAPIRDLWEKWVDILPKMYNPEKNITAHEQLVCFRGRCPFK